MSPWHVSAQVGVTVRLARYPGMIHGFLRRHTLLDQGKAALAEVAEALRAALTPQSGS